MVLPRKFAYRASLLGALFCLISFLWLGAAHPDHHKAHGTPVACLVCYVAAQPAQSIAPLDATALFQPPRLVRACEFPAFVSVGVAPLAAFIEARGPPSLLFFV